jgi:glycosyltransferase involved in cell wall biosynthesis
MKIALIHDWLLSSIGGAENTLGEIYDLYPGPIHTLIWDQKPFKDATIHTSFLQILKPTQFRKFISLFPLAIERFNLSDYNLLISSSHCVAKGIKTHSNQLHICYCHTPMRYAWDLSEEYLQSAGLNLGIRGWLAKKALHLLQKWDLKSSKRVDHFIANSHFVAERIKRNYGRESTVIYPPVDTDFYSLETVKGNSYVTCSRLVAYKKIDLMVDAFANMLDRQFTIIGDGPELDRLRSKATPNIHFTGAISNDELKMHLQTAKAFIFAAIEDFGITPVEAMACGTPVIALRKGGVTETVIDRETGIFFEEQTAASIQDAIIRFEALSFNPAKLAEHAARFSKSRFQSEFKTFVDEKFSVFVGL